MTCISEVAMVALRTYFRPQSPRLDDWLLRLHIHKIVDIIVVAMILSIS